MYYWLTALSVTNVFFLVISICFILRYLALSKQVGNLCETILESEEKRTLELEGLKSNDEGLLELLKEAFGQIRILEIQNSLPLPTAEEQVSEELGFLAPEGETIKVERKDGGDELMLGDIIPKS